MANPTHVSQFAHDIAVKVLEDFDRFDACSGALAQEGAHGCAIQPTHPRVTHMCIIGRILRAFPDTVEHQTYCAPSVTEIVQVVYSGDNVTKLYRRNDRIFREHGTDVLKARTKKLFQRIARKPVRDDNPTEFRLGGVYQLKDCPGCKENKVVAIIPAGQHEKRGWTDQPIVKYADGWDPAYAITSYRRIA